MERHSTCAPNCGQRESRRMFTDGTATPKRVEALLGLLRFLGKGATRESLHKVLQPTTLVGIDPGRVQSKDTLRAAIDLKIVVEQRGHIVPVTEDPRPTREILLDALDC